MKPAAGSESVKALPGVLPGLLPALFAVLAGGCLDKPTKVAEGASSETVIGRVLMPDGSPAAGVAYKLRDFRHLANPGERLPSKRSAARPGIPREGRTGADGGYRIDSVPPGEYRLEFAELQGRGLVLTLAVRPRMGELSLGENVLEALGELTGKVVPANPEVQDSTWKSGYVQVFGLDRAVSLDPATGRFRIPGLPPGRYRLRASASFPFLQSAELTGMEVLPGDTLDIGDFRLNRVLTSNFTSLVPDGLIAYWPCDEGAGTVAVDPVGGNDGALMGGPIWGPGVHGKSLAFDGVDDHIAIPDLYLAGDFTVAAWVRLRGVLDHSQVLLGKEDSANVNFSNARPTLYSGRSGPAPDGSGSADRPWDPVFGVTRIQPDTWTHMAITRRGGGLALYLGGKADAIGTWNDPFPINRIGRGLQLIGFQRRTGYLQGNIDEVRIYDRALTAAEMAALVDARPLP